MTHVTCRLTANNRDQLRNPTLGNRVRAIFTFLRREHNEVSILNTVLSDNSSRGDWHGCIACTCKCPPSIAFWRRWWRSRVDARSVPSLARRTRRTQSDLPPSRNTCRRYTLHHAHTHTHHRHHFFNKHTWQNATTTINQQLINVS